MPDIGKLPPRLTSGGVEMEGLATVAGIAADRRYHTRDHYRRNNNLANWHNRRCNSRGYRCNFEVFLSGKHCFRSVL